MIIEIITKINISDVSHIEMIFIMFITRVFELVIIKIITQRRDNMGLMWFGEIKKPKKENKEKK